MPGLFCINVRPMKIGVPTEIEEEWQAAEAALAAAQKLPGGAERIEPLCRAGRLRFEVDKRRQALEISKQATAKIKIGH
jgi:hypothetical protein